MIRKRYPNSKPLDDAQRKKLCELIQGALCEIRWFGRDGRSTQAGDLANAFHNVPALMWSDEFSIEYFRDTFLIPYQRKYPEPRNRDYVVLVNEIIAMSNQSRRV